MSRVETVIAPVNPVGKGDLSRPRRGDRVVECGGLENLCPGNGTVGSNPTLSANVLFLPINPPWKIDSSLK